jgi:hypothetical protein
LKIVSDKKVGVENETDDLETRAQLCTHKEEEEEDDTLEALQKGLKSIQEPLYYISSIVGSCCRYDADGGKMKREGETGRSVSEGTIA